MDSDFFEIKNYRLILISKQQKDQLDLKHPLQYPSQQQNPEYIQYGDDYYIPTEDFG